MLILAMVGLARGSGDWEGAPLPEVSKTYLREIFPGPEDRMHTNILQLNLNLVMYICKKRAVVAQWFGDHTCQPAAQGLRPECYKSV